MPTSRTERVHPAHDLLTVAKGFGLGIAILLGLRGLFMISVLLVTMVAFLVVGDTLTRLIAIGFFGLVVVWAVRIWRGRHNL